MISKQDKVIIDNIVNYIDNIIAVDSKNNSKGIDWDKVSWIDTLNKLRYNLENVIPYSFKLASEEEIKNKYYTAECTNCGWWGSSRLLNGGGAIADTGDFFDVTCPICEYSDMIEKVTEELKTFKRILVIPDVHGTNYWKEAVKDNTVCKIVFLGDYFDSYNIPINTQIKNFLQILELKKEFPDKVVLLIGNHDYHYFPNIDCTTTSGFNSITRLHVEPILNENRKYFQVSYQDSNLLFTHAGVSETFLNLHVKDYNKDTIAECLNALWEYKPTAFEFNGINPYGDDVQQSPLWIREFSLIKDSVNLKKYGLIQIVGHTKRKKIDVLGKSTNSSYFFVDSWDNLPKKDFLLIDVYHNKINFSLKTVRTNVKF